MIFVCKSTLNMFAVETGDSFACGRLAHANDPDATLLPAPRPRGLGRRGTACALRHSSVLRLNRVARNCGLFNELTYLFAPRYRLLPLYFCLFVFLNVIYVQVLNFSPDNIANQ